MHNVLSRREYPAPSDEENSDVTLKSVYCSVRKTASIFATVDRAKLQDALRLICPTQKPSDPHNIEDGSINLIRIGTVAKLPTVVYWYIQARLFQVRHHLSGFFMIHDSC